MDDERSTTSTGTATLPAGAAPPEERGMLMPGAAGYDDDVPLISPQDDVDYGTMQPKRVTAAILNENAHLLAHPEFNMYLHQTTINLGMKEAFYARVRIINLADRSIVGTLPNEVRDIVQKLFFGGNQRRPTGFTGKPQMDQSLQRSKDIAFAYGVAGFINPRLVLKQEQVTNPETEAWVGTIALHDLQEYMRICEGDDSLAARRLERFLAGSDDAV